MEDALSLQFSVTECWLEPTPAPARLSLAALPPEAEKESFALAVPAVWGVNVTLNEALLPAASVKGREMPLSEYSELLSASELMVTLPPVADKVAFCDLLDPTLTFPNDSEAGETARDPAAVPLPDSTTETLSFDGEVNTLTLPVEDPVFVGAKFAWKVTL